MPKAEGFVVRLFPKTGSGARGKWAADSIKIADADGNEDPFFYQLGFRDDPDVPPAIAVNDYVRFDYEDKDAKTRTIVKGSAVKVAKANQPEQKKVAEGSPANDSSRQTAIHYQSSRSAAIEVVKLLLEHNALKLDGAKTAGAVANRYDQIIYAVDSLTVKYHNDAETHRILDQFSDTGEINTGAGSELPEEVTPDAAPLENGDEPL